MIRLLPDWLRDYRREWLAGDLSAGVLVTLLLVPQGLAYALLAGLPPQFGLYASLAPLLIYAVLGQGRAQSVGPMAVTSLLVAASLSRLAEPGSGDYLALAVGLAVLSGLILLALGFARLGFMADFLSQPVLAAFTSASALIILLSQLSALAGVRGGASLPALATGLWQGLPKANGLALAFGVATLAFLTLARRFGQPLLQVLGLSAARAVLWVRCAPTLAVAVSMLLVSGWGLTGRLPLVGEVPAGLPGLRWPALEAGQWADLLLPAFFIGLINYVQSLSVAQMLAARRGEQIDPDRELLALGACNIGSGLCGGFPVTGGLTRSVVNADAGAQSQLSSLITAFGMALAMLFAASALATLPLSVLAATIISAVAGMVRLDALRLAWRSDKADAAAWLLTFLLVLLLGVDSGIVAGMAVSLAALLWRGSRPHIAELGRVPGTQHFRNRLRHAVEGLPGVLTLRVDESLYFANARQVRLALIGKAAGMPSCRQLVLVMSAVNRIDTTALLMLEELDRTLAERGIVLHLAEVKGPVMDVMERAGLGRRFAGRTHLSLQQAWQRLTPSPDYHI